MKKILNFVKNALFPKRCMVCQSVIEPCRIFCEVCESKIEMLPKDYDVKESFGTENLYFDDIAAPFLYENAPREIMINFKFHGMKENGRYLGEKMYEAFSDKFKADYDGVIYVPTTAKRLRERGFNPAKVLAEVFCEKSGIPLLNGVFVRNPKSLTQHNLSYAERKENAAASYDFGKNPTGKGRYILIDDICTSGSTLNYISKLLKNNGADEVICIVACAGSNTAQK